MQGVITTCGRFWCFKSLQLLLQIAVVFYHKTGKRLLQKGSSITNGTNLLQNTNYGVFITKLGILVFSINLRI